MHHEAALQPEPLTGRPSWRQAKLPFIRRTPSDAPLEPFEALREEFARLGFVAAARREVSWEFRPADIRDPDALAEQLGRLGGREPDGATVESLADDLNRLLDKLPAETWKILAPALRSPGALALRRTAAAITTLAHRNAVHARRINRRLIEFAFPDVIRTISDRELAALFDEAQAHAPLRRALCLSGGGIRSATFSLGVITALAEHKLLGRLDYLSTVSGGGYIGSWLATWMARERRATRGTPVSVEDHLAQPRGTILEPEASPVRHLRLFSSYLSPRLGLFSPDTWTLGATVLRNLALIWTVVVPVILAAFLVPHIIYVVSSVEFGFDDPTAAALLAIGFSGGVAAVQYVHRHRTHGSDPAGTRGPTDGTQNDFLVYCLFPLVAAATAFAFLWNNAYIRGLPPLEDPRSRSVYAVLAIIGALIHLGGWVLSSPRPGFWRRVGEGVFIALTGAAAGAVANAVLLAIQEVAYHSGSLTGMALGGPLILVALSTPALLVATVAAGFAYEGLWSRRHHENQREWNARFSAWLLLTAVGWVVAFAVAISLPLALGNIMQAAWTLGGGIALSWLTSSLGKNAATPATKARGATVSSVALGIAAPLGMLLCLVGLGWLNLQLAQPMLMQGYQPRGLGDAVAVVQWAAMLAAAGIVAGALVDTNKFSLHAMYRSRLVRAYLGASRRRGARTPDPFIDFDERDAVRMGYLAPPERPGGADGPRQPFLVVNTTLNLASGADLAWRERKGESFTITPLHAGAWKTGYRPTSGPGRLYGSSSGDGISLGTAMTISGAAASPNMGYHSSPAVTFLMTLFNARLGWWLGNPGWPGERTFDRSYPSTWRSPIFPIFREMLGRTNDTAKYVYLSDGGHFENLGLYEMVARRCRVIFAVDAGCDPKCRFGDLGNAVQHVRADFGVPIEFTVEGGELAMHSRAERQPGDRPWALARIRYSAVNPRHHDGLLVYIKPALLDTMPADAKAYAAQHDDFPHQTTADQFFSEAQFDAYRALGRTIATEMLANDVVLDEFRRIGFLPPEEP